jgi:transcriptional regulator with XRE-family HTH domain
MYKMDNLKLDMGKRIASARYEKKFTQARIAKELGVTHQCIQKYEKGRIEIPSTNLLKIANLLEKPINFFFHADIDSLPRKIIQNFESSYDVFQDTVLENNVPMLSNKTL